MSVRILRAGRRAHLPAIPTDTYVTDDISYQSWQFAAAEFASNGHMNHDHESNDMAWSVGRAKVASMVGSLSAGKIDRGAASDWAEQRDSANPADPVIDEGLVILALSQVRTTDEGQPQRYVYEQSK